MNLDIYGVYIAQLIQCAISGEKPPTVTDEINTEVLLKIIDIHRITNLVYKPLAELGINDENTNMEHSLAIALDANQQYIWQELKDNFESNKIRFVGMKGIVLKSLYPSSDMRTASDLDIFVDDENTDRVKEIMEEIGFQTERFSHKMQDDSYRLGKLVHIEIHRKLISNKCPWDEKCQDIIERIFPKSEGSYEHVMSNEDFYLHMIGHMAKHMKYSGFGIRMIVDAWLYLNKYGTKMDNTILNKRLAYCGLYKFNEQVLKLIDYWFNGKSADESTAQLARYVVSSGIFGNSEQFFATEVARNSGKTRNKKLGKIIRIVNEFFLPYGRMCLIYPKLEKRSFMLPIYWFMRGIRILGKGKNHLAEFNSQYDKVDMELATDIYEFKKGLGLE